MTRIAGHGVIVILLTLVTQVGGLAWLMARDPRVGKVFLHPHLVARLDAADPKIRFQGCRAARHDDNIHLQL
ncbi:hypothetical protein [Jannaschia aquimarina]|uniref:Uncharacterized protein n=1 Tax=Jannaschia aquimarina TaxID=935700 RepID=A0A0D1EC96_9RHOB|nr:hypothetical protein [Jannaschia aquimarina]KIT14546.1 hypothetical protein jaqu_38360 [Jannaschia aquimarina]SNT35400.1 hypothetical protein SAMN05421775_112116 [Jannaschia aquimarina]